VYRRTVPGSVNWGLPSFVLLPDHLNLPIATPAQFVAGMQRPDSGYAIGSAQRPRRPGPLTVSCQVRGTCEQRFSSGRP
jgi:hypothetical protein